tara:strand:+ start:1638 stop:2420 length:783 start_codon:yes stop_codon:yes gene_type:complete
MLQISQELRHFETIFVWSDQAANAFRARIFDLSEELPFAGHPILGAACAMHARSENSAGTQTWNVELPGSRTVTVDVRRTGIPGVNRYEGSLDQGRPEFLTELSTEQIAWFANAFSLNLADIAPYRPQVISTGLRYLIIPVASNLKDARICVPNLEDRLEQIGADYAYLFDPQTFEGRHWNNDGVLEDLATGSAAGPVGCFAVKHGLALTSGPIKLRQGHFINRPSELEVTVTGTRDDITGVHVAGSVSIMGQGTLFKLP